MLKWSPIDGFSAFDPIGSAAGGGGGGNTSPTADAGPDQSVESGAAVALAGGGSDPDEGAVLTFLWEQISGPAVVLSDDEAEAPTFTAPTLAWDDEAAVLVFQLRVSDGESFDLDTISVTVSPPDPVPPVAAAGADQTHGAGVPIRLDGSGSSDAQGGSLTYAWTQTGGSAVTLDDATAAQPEFTAPSSVVGDADKVLTFSLVVTNPATGLSSSADVCTVTLKAPVRQLIDLTRMSTGFVASEGNTKIVNTTGGANYARHVPLANPIPEDVGRYWEVLLTDTSGTFDANIGIVSTAKRAFWNSESVGGNGSYGIRGNGDVWGGGAGGTSAVILDSLTTFGNAARLMFLFNAKTGFLNIGLNGTWYTGSAGVPLLVVAPGTYYAAIAARALSEGAQIFSVAEDFSYSVPSGARALGDQSSGGRIEGDISTIKAGAVLASNVNRISTIKAGVIVRAS